MTYHILNGDCLKDQFKQTNITGEYIICRECLIDGALSGDTLPEFWATRAKYISETYQETTDGYFKKVVKEFDKIANLPEYAEICLWFENDLFCQVNLWFILSLLNEKSAQFKIFRVFPTIINDADMWRGFGISNSEILEQSCQNRIPFEKNDVVLGHNLWMSFKEQNYQKLTELSRTKSNCFQNLEQVCQAHIERFPSEWKLGRPERVIMEIIETQTDEFRKLFSEFIKREGIYGFGDSQVKIMFDKLMK